MKLSAAVALVALPAIAYADDGAKRKPEPKAARVPTKPRLPGALHPQMKSDSERDVPALDRMPAPSGPAHQVTALATTLTGTYACSGTMRKVDGSLRKTTARMKVATDLDGAWIGFDITENQGVAAAYPLKIRMERTYCHDARTWTNVMRDSDGHIQITTADRASEQAVTWLGSAQRDGARVLIRTHEDRDDVAGVFRFWGEQSSDGKTYVKQYDLTCQK